MTARRHEVNSSSIFSEFDFVSGKKLSSEVKERVNREIGEYIYEATLEALSKGTTPVSGAPYQKSLSKKYLKKKRAQGRGSIANMEFKGDMLEAFDYKVNGNKIRVGIFSNSEEAEKADGHNNFSGKSNLPARQWLAREGQSLKKQHQAAINEIIGEYILQQEDITTVELESINTKKEFWNLMKDKFPGLAVAEIKNVVTTNPTILSKLIAFGFQKWLV